VSYEHYEYVFKTGASCVHKLPKLDHSPRLGIIVYILDANFTGGEVSATVSGKKVSNRQRGECMALATGVSYSVDTVTSGALIVVEFNVYLTDEKKNIYYLRDTKYNPPVWTVHSITAHAVENIPNSIGNNILSCLDSNLCEYSGVVLCLSTFYSITYTTD